MIWQGSQVIWEGIQAILEGSQIISPGAYADVIRVFSIANSALSRERVIGTLYLCVP